MDLIATYFPALADIPDTQAQDARDRLVVWWQKGWPDLDMRVGSVFGDKVVTPEAYKLAAMETAIDRMRSDLTIGNVAGGIVFDCLFVTEYLKNFAIYPQEGVLASGMIRLIFSTDTPLNVDRGLKFQFGNSTDNVFYFRLASPGDVMLTPVGSSRIAGTNTYPFVQLSDTQYAVDVPVEGQMDTPVLAGDVAAMSEALTGLVSATVIADFEDGSVTQSIPALAQLTRTTFYSASMNQRGSAAHWLAKQFPDLTVISPVLTGDAEMIRDTVNPLGFGSASMDIYLRSKYFQRAETHTIRLPYVPAQGEVTVNRFIGQLNLLGIPLQILSIVAVDNTALNLNDGNGSLTIYSQSKDPANAPMLCAGFSLLEQLWASIAMPVDSSGNPLLVPEVDIDGNQYCDFTITYKTDPLLPIVSDYLNSSNVKPVGVNVLVKALLPVTLDSMTVRYTRPSGTNAQLSNAQSQIYSYLLSLGYPAIYSDSVISDDMFYAGASSMPGIDCQGRLRWTVADKVLPESAPTPDVDAAGCDAAAITPPYMDVRSSAGFMPSYRDLNIGTGTATYATAGFRNTGILVDTANIFFREVKL